MTLYPFRYTCLAILGLAALEIGVFLALPAPARSENGGADPDRIALRFGWPGGFASDVTVRVQYTNRTSAHFSESALDGSYRLSTRKQGGGFLVGFGKADFRTRSLGSRDPLTEFFLRAYAAHPDLSIDRTGGLTGFGDFGDHIKALNGRLERFVAGQPPQARTRMQNLAASGIARPLIRSEGRLFWNLLVGLYAGLELEKGKPVERKLEQAVYELNNTVVPMIAWITYSGMAPCPGRTKNRKCVRLDVSTWLDSNAVAREIKNQRATGINVAGIKVVVRDYSATRRIRLLADPETLIPREWRQKASANAQVTVNGKIDVIRQEEETSLSFRRN